MENQEKQYKRLIASLEGLELTESETSTLEWLSGWDYIAINDIISLFKKCRSITAVDWRTVVGTAALAGVASILTSLAGLPELDKVS